MIPTYGKLILCVTIAGLMAACGTDQGRTCSVEFDCFGATGTCQNDYGGTYGPIQNEVLNWHGWVTLGHPKGSIIDNATGDTIVAIRMRTRTQGDNFRVGQIGGGSLFSDVYVSTDGTQVIFNKGQSGSGITDGTTFWSRITPQSPGYNSGRPDFDGLASVNREFDDPVKHPNDWKKVELTKPTVGSRWKSLLSTLPRGLHGVDLYSENEKWVVYLSNGRPMAYDVAAREHKSLSFAKAIPRAANRISIEGENVVIWLNGEEIASTSLAKASKKR